MKNAMSIPRLRPNRRITGMSAVLLPFAAPGEIDWLSFEQHVALNLRRWPRPRGEYGHRWDYAVAG